MNVLVIGDSHVGVAQDLRRFKAASNLILEKKPEYILSIGDFLTMSSLSAWDLNKRALMEGRRYQEDLFIGNEALDLLQSGVVALNNKAQRYKKKLYTPEWIYVEGNHEYWEHAYTLQHAELIGILDYKRDLRLYERGFIHVPYREYIYLNGVGFTHVPMNTVNKPITVYNNVNKALAMHDRSVVFGHHHKLTHTEECRHGAEDLNQALCVGCFMEFNTEQYSIGSKLDWWQGILLLDIYKHNRFDFQTISMESLLTKYL